MVPLIDPNVDLVKNEGIKEQPLQQVYCDEFPEQDPLMADVNADAGDDDPEMELGEHLTGFGLRHRSISFQHPASHFGISLLNSFGDPK